MMRSAVIMCVIGLFLFPEQGFAKKKRRRKKRRKPKIEQVEKEQQQKEIDGSSWSLRGTKKIGVDLLYTPLSDFKLEKGVGARFNLKSDLQLGVDFLMGSEDLSENFSNTTATIFRDASLSGMAIWGYGRYFFGNSFNVMGGVGYRSGNARLRLKAIDGSMYINNDVKISSITAPIAIGNQWGFDSGLTIGVDWIAYMISISGSAESALSTDIADSETNELKKINESIVKDGQDSAKYSSLTLFLTSIGFQF